MTVIDRGVCMMLEDMSKEELWELFPIHFTDYDERFKKSYLDEEKVLKSLIGDYLKRISHIGSTSIKNIKTKPIVDILIEIDFDDKNMVKAILLNSDYVLMGDASDRISFNKGYTINGYADHVFHVHIKQYGNCDELYFRDYLNDNISKAKEYEQLKLELYHKYKPNRDLYTEGKSEYVTDIVNAAKAEYKGKY